MLLDWFTIFAQILNFFLLIMLLKFFLYKPIVGAMQERKERVENETRELREARADVSRVKTELLSMRTDLENREAEVMAEIQVEAERWRQQAMESALAEIETMRREWLASLDREKDLVALNLRTKLSHEVSATAASIVQDLSGCDFEQLIMSGFVQRIADEARNVDCADSDILIRTGFEHTDLQEQKLKQLIEGVFTAKNELVFITDAGLGIGVEIIAGDRKWEWNLNSYIAELETKIFAEMNT
ncbi:ATPase [Maridesulfovibrio sp.]|uniref:F0F1 ATP synthase subunit B family protein n=1 Tax=Maridesulfovibrio sp. TaxID=2795000 RepID=UPI0029C9FD53|nr:ATPase [Maridesulfovibrio sp.]